MLSAGELIPLLSWLAQRGRCRVCHERIDPLLPGIELAALALPLWAAMVPDAPPVWASALLGWVLLCLAVIDARYFLLPDELTLPLLPAGLAVTWLLAPERLAAGVAGVVIAFLAFFALRTGYKRLRGREGLGRGDVKLFAAAGAWVGWDGLPSVILIAAITGLMVTSLVAWRGALVSRDTEVPFGLYLSLGIWLVWLYGPLGAG